MSLTVTDGAEIRGEHAVRADVVVVGSGPAGAAVARTLARAGAKVVVLEEGGLHTDFHADGFTSMAQLYRDLGATLTRGRAPAPYVQGVAVGGTSVVNGAISWRLPRHVHQEWLQADPALESTLPWDAIDAVTDDIEADLHIRPTDEDIAGANNHLLARGAEALGLEHRPIRRNVRDCQGSGRCLQGCPNGAKMSMDRTYLPDAVAAGAEIIARCRVHRIDISQGRATGVRGTTRGGGSVHVRADRVVLAASCVQSPLLLWRSGIRQGPVGRHFQCHPGISLAGHFDEPVRMWTGATQGHEVTGLVKERIKFEALGFDMGVLALRVDGTGRQLASGIADSAHLASWGAAIRATSEGRVRPGWLGGTRVSFALDEADLARTRRALRVLGEMMFAAGAEWVSPGVPGWHARVHDPQVMARFEDEAPRDPRAYTMVLTHMFGTCRMGSDPTNSVVRPDFLHHWVDRLYVADSSVFPSNTGVNPQTSILALATLCARGLAAG